MGTDAYTSVSENISQSDPPARLVATVARKEWPRRLWSKKPLSNEQRGGSNPFGGMLENTVLLSLIGLLNRALTVITQILIAKEFGATLYADAYFAIEIIPDLFIVLVGSGLSMLFIPLYSRFHSSRFNNAGFTSSEIASSEITSSEITSSETNKEAGTEQDEAWRFASAFIIAITLLFLALTALFFVLAPNIVTLLAPGFTGETREVTIALLRVMVLTLAFLGPEAGLRGLFHTNREFATPDLSRFAYNMLLLVSIVLFSGQIGINSIAWGMVVGAGVMIAIQFGRAVQLGLIQRTWSFYHPAVLGLLKKTPAALVILAWPMVMLVLDRRVSSGLTEGNLAALGYAARIAMLPIGIVALPLSTVLYPGFSDLANEGAHDKISKHLTVGMRTLLFVVLPVCVGILVGREVIVKLLFERGAFDATATANTSRLLFFYILAVPGFAAIFFLRGIYMSINKDWSLCLISVGLWIGNALFNLMLVRNGGAEGIALTTAIITAVAPIVLLFHLKLSSKLPVAIQEISMAIGQMILLALVMALLFMGLVAVGGQLWAAPTMLQQVVILSTGGLVSLAGYLLLARLINLPESIWLQNRLGLG